MTIAEDIETLKRQEEALQFDHFSDEDAWALGSLMRARAVEKGLPLVIDIRVAGRPLGRSPPSKEGRRSVAPSRPPLRLPPKLGRSSSSVNLPSLFLSSFLSAATAPLISSAEISPLPSLSSAAITGNIRMNPPGPPEPPGPPNCGLLDPRSPPRSLSRELRLERSRLP